MVDQMAKGRHRRADRQLTRVVALDIDPRHGGDESLAQWEVLNGTLPFTKTTLTGGGGRHLLFRHPPGETIKWVPGSSDRA